MTARPHPPGAASPELDRILDKLDRVRRCGDYFKARCPAHDDREPSLALGLKADGSVWLRCYGGCEKEPVLWALGLDWHALYPPDHPYNRNRKNGKHGPSGNGRLSPNGNGKHPGAALDDRAARNGKREERREERRRGEFVCAYDYVGPEGELLFQTVRFRNPKDFSQRRPDGRGGWIWNLKGVEPVLYHLPEVLRAVADGKLIFLVEGEKDADRLRALGFCATTCPMGAKKWKPGYTESLRGAGQVILLPDHDRAGQEHAEQVVRELGPVVHTLKIVELPELGEKEDVSDWLGRGGTVEALLGLVREAPPWEPPPPEEEGGGDWGPGERYPCTDLGNAERLVDQHGADLRYCWSKEAWLVWDGAVWAEEPGGELMRRAVDTVLTIDREVKSERDPDRRGNLSKHYIGSQKLQRLEAMIKLARSRPSIPVELEQLDQDPWLLNLRTHTLDLRTGEARPHRREDYLTVQVPIDWDPEAECPLWRRFLDDVMLGDQEMIAFLKRSVGYALTGDTREQCLWLHHGGGSNGKSTFMEVLLDLLGPYGHAAQVQTFLHSKGERVRDDVAELLGKRLVTAAEPDEGRRIDEALVKSLTGGDTIRARFLFGRSFQFKPQFKLHLSANHRPPIRGWDNGIWRRMRLIPWPRKFEAHEADKEMPRKLRAELPGILRWAVEGCLEWQENGLCFPQKVLDATDEYREEMDTVHLFASEWCVRVDGARTAFVTVQEAFRDWCEQNGQPALPPRALNARLKQLGFEKSATLTDGRSVWENLGLIAHDRRAPGSHDSVRRVESVESVESDRQPPHERFSGPFRLDSTDSTLSPTTLQSDPEKGPSEPGNDSDHTESAANPEAEGLFDSTLLPGEEDEEGGRQWWQ